MKDQRRATAFGLGAVAAWSTVATAFKLALRHLEPTQLLFTATAVSLLTLTLVLAWQRRLGALRATPPAARTRALLLGLLNPFLYYLVLFAAYDRLPAQVAQPVNYTWALTLSWLSIPLLGQKARLRDLLAGVVCYGGVALIATGGDVSGFRTADPLGVGLAL
ncbi:MAG TPA: DMT family transporter, partial [Candidatus Krumholzibacteria bacterium]|nr:DMT family transporter [Candidatus Krumholzibacteria bacterium]HRX52504.1 DMT family transporter [Candidatus Krumholzibacteria bacterium]